MDNTVVCARCGHELQVGDFPFCKGSAGDHAPGRYGVIADDIPGGLDVRHGICHEDGSPRRYYSKSEMKREADRRGLTNYVTHIGAPGSDKSVHTVRWV